MPDPFSAILTNAAGSVAASILIASTRATRRWLSGDERHNALEACCGAGLSALIASARTSGKDDESHLHTMFELAFQNDALVRQFGQELQACLDGKELDVGEVVEIFAEHDRALAEFPGLEPEVGLRQLEAAFVMAAVRQPVLQGELISFHAREQTQLQTAMLEQLQRIAVQLESLPLQGAAFAGVQLILQALPLMPGLAALPAGADEFEKARRRYLERLITECQALPLQQLGGQGDGLGEVQLSDVYVELRTKSRLTNSEEKKLHAEGIVWTGDRDELLLAQEAAETMPRLVLLGDPGSGKSSFVRHIAARLAKAQLDGTAPPAWAEGLLPILVVLRDLAPHLAGLDLAGKSAERRREALTEALYATVIEAAQRSKAQAFEQELGDALVDGECLLILDGLDEVRAKLRPLVVETVQAALQTHRLERVIVTCRVRSYEGEARLPDFEVHELAPFDEDQVKNFVAAWYQAQSEKGYLSPERAQERVADLQRAAGERDLEELAENPMLLTTMALIHQQNIGLPRQRVRLYDEAVKILLVRWQKRKGLSPDIAEQIGPILDDEHRIRPILERLAFEVHKAEQEVGKKGADADEGGLDRLQLLGLLEAPEYLGSLSLAEAFLDYVDDRAGILVGRGGGPDEPLRYSFPHRTFQEYLAGCYLTTLPDPVGEIFELAAAGDFWTLAVQLGVEELVYCRRIGHLVPRLASGLFPAGTRNKSQKAKRASLWASWMAALLEGQPVTQPGTQPGSEVVSVKGPEPWSRFVSRCRRRLVTLVPKGLPVRERVEAGCLLAKLGDPRPAVMTVEGMEFCRVIEGPFWMGSEKDLPGWPYKEAPLTKQSVAYDFWLARFPVTQAQFGAFGEAEGYRQARYWRAAEAAGYWNGDSGYKERWAPVDFPQPFGLPNHPVVGVSWFEALAYCAWLEDRARREGWLPKGWAVTLPSELEWEKAARGGEWLEMPAACLPLTQVGRWRAEPGAEPVRNGQPQRIYPWGDEFELDLVNCHELQLDATNAAGVFLGGRSSVGCEEMVGLVWEWTRSLAGDPPYPPAGAERECRELANSEFSESRVVRGGSWNSNHDPARAARCATGISRTSGTTTSVFVLFSSHQL